MTVPTWTAKAGDGFTAPQAIHVQVASQDVDLSDPAWEVASQGRLDPADIDPAVTFTFDADLLADSKVLLKVDRLPQTPGVYEVDVEIANGTLGIRQSSQTFFLELVADATRVVS